MKVPYEVVRRWTVLATDPADAVSRALPGEHQDVSIHRMSREKADHSMTDWRVYGSQPMPVTVRSERAARRLARKYRRLGMRSHLYVSDNAGNWELRAWLDEHGQEVSDKTC